MRVILGCAGAALIAAPGGVIMGENPVRGPMARLAGDAFGLAGADAANDLAESSQVPPLAAAKIGFLEA